MPKAKATGLKTASLRDFGGGWNVADAEYNLSSRFLPLADNIEIGVDGSVGPRFGYRLDFEFRDGITYNPVNITANITTNTGGYVTLTITGHPFANEDHITISGIASAINGIPASELNGTHGVLVVDANNIRIQTRTTATSTGAVSRSYTYVRDTNTLSGRIIECAFFQNYIIVMDDRGEIARVNQYTGVKAAIWNIALAYGTAGNPRGWGPCDHYSFDTWRQTLIVVNGRNNDKPIEIDNERPSLAPTQYLVDPATSSNTYVYSADYVLTHGNYLLLVGANNPNTPSTNTPTLVEISAEGTSGVFTGNPAPDDAVQIDLGRVTTTVDPKITGASSIRDEVWISFYDTAMLGKLGIYESSIHKPDFKDQIPQHGALNHRVTKNVGNDLFTCDYAGVPAFTQSLQSGAIVPERLSELIDPALVTHFARLDPDTLKKEVWGIFNTRDRQYMLFVPKFDSASEFDGDNNGIYCLADLASYSIVLVRAEGHTVAAGDYVVVSGASSISGLGASDINGTRRVVEVIDKNTFLMQVGAVPSVLGVSGGGTSILFAPVNDEHIGYIYKYYPKLKVKRWTRYRDLKFDAGCLSKDGTVFFARDGKIFSWGTNDRAYPADAMREWDYVWTTATTYVEGERVRETSSSSITYICVQSHMSSGTFASDVVDNQDYWIEYKGLEIDWAAETPWSDFGQRPYKKICKYIKEDTTGTGRFKVSVFVDNIHRDRKAQELSPLEEVDYAATAVSQEFVGRDVGGFGAGMQNYGTGLRTREQLNFEFPFECQLAKIRISGRTAEPIRIVGLTLLYQLGSIMR